MYTDEVICKQLTRIADALERIAHGLEFEEKSIPCPPVMRSDSLISETQAAEYRGLSKAWFQQKRVTEGGPAGILFQQYLVGYALVDDRRSHINISRQGCN